MMDGLSRRNALKLLAAGGAAAMAPPADAASQSAPVSASARVALDSLSALERVGTVKSFREFVIGLTSFIKHRQITGLFTATTAALMGGTSITEANISSLTLYEQLHVTRYPPGSSSRIARRLISL